MSPNKSFSNIEHKNSYLRWFRKLGKWQKISSILILSGIVISGLILTFNIVNNNNKTAKASSLDTGFYQINQILVSPDDQILYVRGGGNSDGTTGIKTVNANTNTDLGVSVNYTGTGSYDMLLNQDGSKLYLILGNRIDILNTSDLSLVTSINVNTSLFDAKGIFNSAGTKLYVGRGSTVDVINTANNTVSATISDPTITLNQTTGYDSRHNRNGMVFSPDGSKLYLAGGKYIDTATDTLNSINLLSGTNANGYDITLNQDGSKMYVSGGTGANISNETQAFGNRTKVINLNTGTLEKLLPFGLKFLSPDGSKLYIIIDEGAGITNTPNRTRIRVYDTRNNLEIAVSGYLPDSIDRAIMSADGSTIYASGFRPGSRRSPTIDLNSLTYSSSINEDDLFISEPRALSNDGKSIFYSTGRFVSFDPANPSREASVIILPTQLLTPSANSSFNCNSPTNSLGSTVTCTVNIGTPSYGLAKFNVGLESCTAYFPAIGGNSASCTYIANNIQTSTITMTPSFGAASTSVNTLAISGGSNNVTISSANITTNNSCTPSSNLPIRVIFDCDFSLTGSTSNSYILPPNGIRLGLNTTTTKSNLCTLLNNGTPNAKLSCKNIGSLGGTAGTQNIRAFINNNATGNNIGTVNLTDGFLVNSTLDAVDSVPGDGFCNTATGLCTLRAAVMEANSDYIKDKITIPAGDFQLTIAPTTNSFGSIDGDLDINTDIDFIGAGKNTTFIQAGSNNTNGIDRVFHIFNTNVNMSGLTIRYGRVLNNLQYVQPPRTFPEPKLANGGGIYYQRFNDFSLNAENDLNPQTGQQIDVYSGFRKDFNLTDVIVSDNYAQNSGGGVYNSALYTKITNTEIINNESGKYGGGLSRALLKDVIDETKPDCFNSTDIGPLPAGELDLVNSKLNGNKTRIGAGLYHDHANKIKIDATTEIINNIASENGGGIFNSECTFVSAGSTITINGATISGNTALNGGGIYNQSGRIETFTGTKILNNTATGKGSAWFAGNIATFNNTTETIVSQNNNSLDYAAAQPSSVFSLGRGSETKILRTSIDNNYGRAVEFDSGAAVNIDQSLIYFNSGRGVSFTGDGSGDASLTMENTTISENNSSAIRFSTPSINFSGDFLTIASNAFGISVSANVTSLNSFNLTNSILSGSFYANCSDASGNPLTFSLGNASNNLTNTDSCAATVGFTENSDVATFLGPVQDNTGFTKTRELLPGSPAIDAVSSGVSVDQRNLPRPAGSNYDIGAFETQGLSPRANDDTGSTDPNSPISLDVLTNDTPGNDPIDSNTVTVVDQPTKGTLNDDGNGNFTYTPDAGQFTSTGTDTFTYYFLDTTGIQSNTAKVTITINVASILPVANDDTISLNPNNSININVLDNDVDAISICDGSILGVTNGTAVISGTEIIYTPNNNYTGSDTFTYKACNNDGESNVATVNITVNNNPPTAVNDTITLPAFDVAVIDVSSNDTDPQGNNALDKASIQVSIQPTKGTVSVNTTLSSPDLGKITFTPNSSNFNTSFSDTFSYTIKDKGNPVLESNVATVTVLYTPVSNNDSVTTDQGVPVVINVLSNDIAADSVCDTGNDIFTNPTKGTIILSSDKKRFTYTPTGNNNGADSFTYKTCNPNGSSNFATADITITPIVIQTPRPIANTDSATTPESTPVTIPVLTNDTNVTNICVGSILGVTNGTAIITNVAGADQIQFTPTSGYFGSTSFTYTACDSAGTASNAAIVNVTVVQNIVPVITQNIQLTLYKEKLDNNIIVNDPLKIQADIKNPNNRIVPKVETIINIDTTKLNFVPGSARVGSISGTKYSSIFRILNNLSISVEAASNVTFEELSASQLKVTALNMEPNETINVIFDVTPKASIRNSISGNTSIIDPVTNQQLATANAEVSISPSIPIFVLVRTGGFQTGLIIIIATIVGLGVGGYLTLKRRSLIVNK